MIRREMSSRDVTAYTNREPVLPPQTTSCVPAYRIIPTATVRSSVPAGSQISAVGSVRAQR
jgi:hypothetical protein